MRISFRMDISTIGAHEGLFISTGLFTPTSAQQHDRPLVWPTWPSCPSPSTVPTAPIRASPLTLQQNAIFEEIKEKEQIGRSKEIEHQEGEKPSNQNYYDQQNELSQDRDISGDVIIGNRLEHPSTAQLQEERMDGRIRLNVFGQDNQPTELVPTWRRFGTSPQSSWPLTDSKSDCDLPGPPLLSDTSTTTTTLEVFRTRPDSANFLQIPKSPLGQSKEGVEIIPVRGPEYERRDRSETQFSGRLNPVRRQSPSGRSVQWGATVPIPPSPSASSSPSTPSVLDFSATPNSPDLLNSSSAGLDLPLSPPQQTSTPLPSSTFPSLAIASPPDNKLASDLTILRRQWQHKNERHLLVEGEGDSSFTEAECPPRPPKRQTVGTMRREGRQTEREAPPRPPKPRHLLIGTLGAQRERSQSVGAVHRTGEVPLRSASSNEILKLYQTRDCLGRLVCEW